MFFYRPGPTNRDFGFFHQLKSETEKISLSTKKQTNLPNLDSKRELHKKFTVPTSGMELENDRFELMDPLLTYSHS